MQPPPLFCPALQRAAPYGSKSQGRGGGSRFGGRDFRRDAGSGGYGGGGGRYGGGGGGYDLAAAGAIPARTLRPGQARIMLAALIANGSSKDAIVHAFSDNQ